MQRLLSDTGEQVDGLAGPEGVTASQKAEIGLEHKGRTTKPVLDAAFSREASAMQR